jgi:hypothetical protein
MRPPLSSRLAVIALPPILLRIRHVQGEPNEFHAS